MFFDTLSQTSAPFSQATASGCMVLDAQPVADFFVKSGVQWKTAREEDTDKAPRQVLTFVEYPFTESGDGGADHWTIGNLLRLVPTESVEPHIRASIKDPDEALAEFTTWAQVDTFLLLRGVKRPAGTHTKMPMGRPIHSANVFLLGFRPDGTRVRSIMAIPDSDWRVDRPFGWDRMMSVYQDCFYPVMYPSIPLAAFAQRAGGLAFNPDCSDNPDQAALPGAGASED